METSQNYVQGGLCTNTLMASGLSIYNSSGWVRKSTTNFHVPLFVYIVITCKFYVYD